MYACQRTANFLFNRMLVFFFLLAKYSNQHNGMFGKDRTSFAWSSKYIPLTNMKY
jgi:hypothetical protein